MKDITNKNLPRPQYFITIAIWVSILCVMAMTVACSTKPTVKPVVPATPVPSTPAKPAEPLPEPTKPSEPSEVAVTRQEAVAAIRKAVDATPCSAPLNWTGRGRAAAGHYHGIATTFAIAVCNPDTEWAKAVSTARRQPESQHDAKDVLSWYNSNFKAAGLSNDTAGIATLQNLMTLQLGLGVRESNGKFCKGRDRSANFSSADSAEAGAWQTSWGMASRSLPLVQKALFEQYRTASTDACYLDQYRTGAACDEYDGRIWGTGTGAEWQRVAKTCPHFSAQYAAIGMRYHGGNKGEFGPLRRKEAQINMSCHAMLGSIRTLVEKNPEFCKVLK